MARRSIYVPQRSSSDLRRLPDPVIRRLLDGFGQEAVAERHRGVDIEHRGKIVEHRAVKRIELRQTGDGDPIIDGYATVYDVEYDVFGGPPFGWTETIVGGALGGAVRDSDPVYLFFDHEGLPIASTRAGTLDLTSDSTGLHNVARPDTESQFSMEIVSRLGRGELDAMSFAFALGDEGRQEWNEDFTKRFITIIQHLFDTSVVSFPANPATSVGLRADRAAPTSWRGHRVARRSRRAELQALPDEVLTRGLDLTAITTQRRGQELIEARTAPPLLDVTHRDDGTVELHGYVAAYDRPTQVGDEQRGWSEILATGAFDKTVTDDPDVRLLLAGEGMPLARSRAGTLTLSSDDFGLQISATLNAERHEDTIVAVQRGDAVKAQVGMDVVRQQWDEGHTRRRVSEARLRDITLIVDSDPAAADALDGLADSRSLVDVEPDGEHLSLEMARAIADSISA